MRRLSETGSRSEGKPVGTNKSVNASRPGAQRAGELVTFTAASLMQKTLPPLGMLVPGLIPQGLIILAGRPKIGKSWLVLDLAISVASGRPFFGRKTDPGEVLLLALEDGERRLQSRLRIINGGVAPPSLHLATSCPSLGNGGAEAIRRWCDNASNPRAIVVDVFQRIRSRTVKSARLYEDDYDAALPLKEIADDFGIAVINVVHCRKAMAEDDPLDAVSATTGLTGAADHVLILNRSAKGLTLYGRGRDIEELDLAVRLDPRQCRWELIGNAAEVERSESRNAIIIALQEASEALGPKDISERSKVDYGVAKVLIGRMVKSGELIKVGRAQYALPPTPVTLFTGLTLDDEEEGERRKGNRS
jgi:hypothetical protein